NISTAYLANASLIAARSAFVSEQVRSTSPISAAKLGVTGATVMAMVKALRVISLVGWVDLFARPNISKVTVRLLGLAQEALDPTYILPAPQRQRLLVEHRRDRRAGRRRIETMRRDQVAAIGGDGVDV